MTQHDADLIIESAIARDLPEIVEIENRSFETPWSYRALETEVKRLRPQSNALVARDHGRVVGYALFWSVVDELHLLNIAVHPDKRRQGVARALMRGVFAEARRQRLKRITLEVRVSNNGAIRLYQSIGFQIAAIRRGYYQDTGEDAYIMWLNEIEPEEERKPTRFWRRTK